MEVVWGGGGSDGTVPGKFCTFRFKFIAFKAMLMYFISRSLSLINQDILASCWDIPDRV